jgi:hypothetical protein
VEDDANSYLADAGVEKRPAGFRWFIRLPGEFSIWDELRAPATGPSTPRIPSRPNRPR